MTDSKDWTDLNKILDHIWLMLAGGAANADDPCRRPALGTTGLDGAPNLRTVVLRQALESERRLICYTDARSPKVQEIRRIPVTTWLFYHPQHKMQLRITGSTTLHTDDDLADRQWAAAPLGSRRLYCELEAPGTPKAGPTSGLPDFLEDRDPTPAESEAGRPNFLAIACQVESIDWLFLRDGGHRRARFVWQENKFTATWLVP